jgi:hypothetical protein
LNSAHQRAKGHSQNNRAKQVNQDKSQIPEQNHRSDQRCKSNPATKGYLAVSFG